MNNENDRIFDIRDEYLPLAQWLQLILANTPNDLEAGVITVLDTDDQFIDTDHMKFYRQIPDFAQALLKNPTREDVIRFGPLVFHLIACPACRTAYREIYEAMSATIGIKDEQTITNQLPQPATNTLTRAQVYTCQLLIHQASDVLREAHHSHKDQDAWARSLLQHALYLSSKISESSQRQRALHDLVEVATLFDKEDRPEPASHSYLPVLSGGTTSGQKTTRRLTDTPGHPDGQSAIRLQTKFFKLDGTITQHNNVLELHLENLDQELRGRFLLISVPCGLLLEPVRWIGGNPRAIKSAVPVGEDGSLTTPLGSTHLQLSNQEEHNLLEALFIILNVRSAE
jgi:hypothetical protein